MVGSQIPSLTPASTKKDNKEDSVNHDFSMVLEPTGNSSVHDIYFPYPVPCSSLSWDGSEVDNNAYNSWDDIYVWTTDDAMTEEFSSVNKTGSTDIGWSGLIQRIRVRATRTTDSTNDSSLFVNLTLNGVRTTPHDHDI